MNDENTVQFHRYYLKSLRAEIPPIIFHREVLTVGRSDTCDVKIDNPYLSHVHASIFFNNGDFYLSDLNSTNGTYVNEERVKVVKLKIGDIIRFGAVKYQLMPLEQLLEKSQENTLETLNPLHQSNVLDKLTENVSPPDFNVVSNSPKQVQRPNNSLPVIKENTFAALFVSSKPVTPLDLVPALNYSEYIFEENAEGNAIDFSQNQPTLEITIFINDFVVSVDYFLASQGSLFASGKENTTGAITFPFLSQNTQVPFLVYKDQSFGIYDYTENSDWKIRIYGQDGVVENFKVVDGYIKLKKEYIITIESDKFNVVIKQTDAPPKTIATPFFLLDKFFNKVVISVLPIYVALLVGLMLMPVKEKDFDEQKIEIDRIVYVKDIPPPVFPPRNREDEILPEASKSSAGAGEITKSQKIDVPPKEKPIDNTAVSLPPKPKAATVKPIVPPANISAPAVNTKVTSSKVVTKDVALVNNEAAEAIPPRLDLKALQNKVGKKLESAGVASNVISNKLSDELEGAKSLVGANSGAQVKDVGPLQSASTGIVNVSGAQTGDLGKGKNIKSNIGGDIGFFDGTGGKKVLMGILDPTEVQNILRRYIPQFQFCYEKELERTNSKVATTLVLEFSINGEGKPMNATFDSKNITFTPAAIKCFEQVIYSIQFSKPKGGGVVGIRQPLNMEPRF